MHITVSSGDEYLKQHRPLETPFMQITGSFLLCGKCFMNLADIAGREPLLS